MRVATWPAKYTHCVHDLEQLQDHELPALHGARLQDLKNGKQPMGADYHVLDFRVLPEQAEL